MSFKCPFCGRKTVNLSYLRRHIRRDHPTDVRCPVCRFKSRSIQGLILHCSEREDEKHKALYFLLHRNKTADTTVENQIEKLKELKKMFEANDDAPSERVWTVTFKLSGKLLNIVDTYAENHHMFRSDVIRLALEKFFRGEEER